MEERTYRRPRTIQSRPMTAFTDKARSIFFNTCVLCGTTIVLAVTVKVILSLFS